MKAKTKRIPIMQRGGLPRPIRRPELGKESYRMEIVEAAEALMAEGAQPPATREDEATLFKALHACAYVLEREDKFEAGTVRGCRKTYRRLVDHLVQANLGLIYDMRRRVGPGDGDEDEYRSAGFWSLYQAILAFDPWRGLRFSTYACNAILHGYGQIWKRSLRRRRVLRPLVEENPTPTTDAEQVEPSVALLKDRLEATLQANSAGLNATERFIIERRFLGQGSQRKMTLADIGKLIKLSKERVRQLQIGALNKLRAALELDPVARDLLPAHMN